MFINLFLNQTHLRSLRTVKSRLCFPRNFQYFRTPISGPTVDFSVPYYRYISHDRDSKSRKCQVDIAQQRRPNPQQEENHGVRLKNKTKLQVNSK